MTRNMGTEYINLKQAKYSRDVRRVQNPAHSKQPAVSTDGAAVLHSPSMRTSAQTKPAYGAREVLGDVTHELGKTIAEKRRNAEIKRRNAPVYAIKKAKTVKAFPLSAIGYMIVFALIAMFLVLGNSRINEATLKAESLRSAIAKETERNEILTTRINTEKDAESIEDYAVNVLGLVKSTEVAKRYVNISGEDKVVVSGSEAHTGESTRMTLALDSIG